MKLISPKRTGQQSLGRNNSSVTAEAGKAAAISTATKGISDAATSLAGASEDILLTNNKRQSQQAELFMKKEDKEFWDQYGGRDFFDASEVPEEFLTDGKMIKGRIASAEVLPQMYASMIQESLPNASKIVENEKLRADWMADAQVVALNRQQAVQTKANSEIERQIFVDQQINFKNAMDSDEPAVALELAGQMDGVGNPAIVEEHKIKAKKGMETLKYKDAINNDRPVEMKVYLEHLKQPYEDYQKDDRVGVSELDALERSTWINKLESALRNAKKDSANSVSINKKAIKREHGMVKRNSMAGIAPSPDERQDLFERTLAMEKLDPGSMTTEILDQIALQKFDDANANNLVSNRFERESNIKAMKGAKGIPEFERNSIALNMQKSHDAQTQLENTDFMQSVSNAGLFTKGLSPVNFQGDPIALTKQLSDRFTQFEKARATYGDGLGNGVLTKDEAASFSSVIDSKNAQDQAELIASIGGTFGRSSVDVYEQLSIDGSVKSFAVAGVLSAHGQQSMAEHVLNGNEYRRSPDVNLNDLTSEMRPKLYEKIGRAYRSNNKYNAAMQEAIVDAYIGMAKDTTDLQNIENGGWFSEDVFQKAVDGVTGGIIEQAGSKIPTPEYGMGQDAWDDHIDYISPDYIDELGGVAGKNGLSVDSKDFVESIKNGEVKFVSTSKGRYILTNEIGEPYGSLKGGSFEYVYDPTYTPSPNTGASLDKRAGK